MSLLPDEVALPRVDFTVAEAWADPRAVLMPALARSPVARGADGALWMLTHEGVVRVLKDRHFEAPNLASRHGKQSPAIVSWAGQLMGSMNGDQHRRTRGLVQRAFTARMAEDLRPRMQAILVELFGRALAEGSIRPLGELPGRMMTYMLGVPSSDYDHFIGWVDDLGMFFNVDLANPDISARVSSAITSLSSYLRDLAERTEREAGPDLLGELAKPREEGQLSIEEVVIMATNLLSAGTDTTRNSIEFFCYLLAKHPDQMAVLRLRPELVPQAVEELLRFEPPVPFQMRVAGPDAEAEGLGVRTGDKVMISLVSADRDPAAWDDPDTLDFTRENAPRAQVFGGGAHVCLGAPLARAELQEFLHALIAYDCQLTVLAEPHFQPFQILRRMRGLEVAVRTG